MVTMESQSPLGRYRKRKRTIVRLFWSYLKNVQLSLLTRSNLHAPAPFSTTPTLQRQLTVGLEVETVLPKDAVTGSQGEFWLRWLCNLS